MNQTQQEQAQSTLRQGGRWLRIGILTLTTVGPIINSLVGRIQQRRERLNSGIEQVEARQEVARNVQTEALRRLDDFTVTSRRVAAEQAQQLQKQARQLREQARILRKALRREAEQRRQLQKLVKQMQKTGAGWSGEVLKRGEDLTGMLAAQSGKISREVIERSNEFTQNLTERGQQLVQGGRKQNRTFWSVFGFSVGLVAAATATFLLIRRRMIQHAAEEDEHFELPETQEWSASGNGRPAGEILHIDGNEMTVETMETVEVDNITVPEEAAYVGFISTKLYFPREHFREQYAALNDEVAMDDLIYFLTEEDAQEQGFSRKEA
jgi:hypothetical protein